MIGLRPRVIYERVEVETNRIYDKVVVETKKIYDRIEAEKKIDSVRVSIVIR